MTFIGIVPAAGTSTRLGRDKRLLQCRGETFIEIAVRKLKDGGCGKVIVIVDRAFRSAVAGLRITPPATILELPAPTATMRETLEFALACIEDPDIIAVLPVDCPLIAASTIADLHARFVSSTAAGLVPYFQGQQGHPRLLRGRLFRRIPAMDVRERFSSIFRLAADEVVSVEVADGAIIQDIDTEADLAAFERRSEGASFGANAHI